VSLHALQLTCAERDTERRAKALKMLEQRFAVLDSALADRLYLLCDEFSVAYLNVAAVISRAIDMDLAATPRLENWLKLCLDRPAARAALVLRAAADAAVPLEVT